MEERQKKELARQAIEARKQAYAPYSDFAVGAALLTKEREVFTGCNIENGSYPAGNCAERTAIFSAVATGKLDFLAIAVAGGKRGKLPEDFCMPCGICLQVMGEFCSPDFEILIVRSEEEWKCFTLGQLLPAGFTGMQGRKEKGRIPEKSVETTGKM